MKNKILKPKQTEAEVISWFPCPHCGKIIMSGSKEYIKALKKWVKQKSKK